MLAKQWKLVLPCGFALSKKDESWNVLLLDAKYWVNLYKIKNGEI